MKSEDFRLGAGQSAIFEADVQKYRTLIACSGEQGGKTILGAIWLRHQIDQWGDRPANFVVGAPTYKILEQSTRPTFMKLVSKNMGKYDGKDDAFRMTNGGNVYFRSGTDSDSVIGIPDCAAGWIDEAGKCARMFFLNIQGRVARLQGPVLCTSTPYAMNWLWELIREAETRNDILYQRWRSIDNPVYPKAEYERLRKILPARVFKMRLEGLHDRAEGLIFQDFDENNYVDGDVKLVGATYVGGIDWGFDHPFALSIRAILGDQCYGVSFFKGSGLSTEQQLQMIENKTRQFGIKHWACGHDRPEQILELNKKGIVAFKYFEHQREYREVNNGNAKLAELIKAKKYRILRNAAQIKDLEDEYATYCWDKDLDEDRKREKPVNSNDDLIAAERYCTVGSLHLLTSIVPQSKMPIGYFQNRDVWSPTSKKSDKEWDSF